MALRTWRHGLSSKKLLAVLAVLAALGAVGWTSAASWKVEISAKEVVEFIVRADPSPENRVALALANDTALLDDAGRPNIFVARKLLETEGWVVGVLREMGIRAACGKTVWFG